MDKKNLSDEQLEEVVGGAGQLYDEESRVRFEHNVGDTIILVRNDIFDCINAVIRDRGIHKDSKGKFYACYDCDVSPYTGSGWLGDIGGIKFQNRIGVTPYKTGL